MDYKYKTKVLNGTGVKMMKSFFVLLHLCLLYVDSYFVDYRAARVRLQRREGFPCTTKGTFCGDCETVVSCNANGSIPEVMATCSGETKCNDEGKSPACIATPSRKCSALNYIPFKCAMNGIFTDPIECNKYHYCVDASSCGDGDSKTTLAPTTTTTTPAKAPFDPSSNFIAVKKYCPPNFSFNIATRYCDKALPGNVCPKNQYPIKLCSTPGEMFIVQGPTYVRCIQEKIGSAILYPYQYVCETGKTFAGVHPC